MPEAVGAAIVYAAEAIFYAGEMVYTAAQITAIGYAATTAASVAYSQSRQRSARKRANAAQSATLRDRTLTVRGTLEERDLVMGRVRKGGYFYPIGTSGPEAEKFTFIVLMAGHSISAVNTCYFDGNALTLDVDGWVTSDPYAGNKPVSATADVTLSSGSGSVVLAHTPIGGTVSVYFAATETTDSSLHTPSVSGSTVTVSGFSTHTGTGVVHYQYMEAGRNSRIRWMMGSDSQTAFADLITDFPSLWTSAHRLRGCAYAVIELLYSPDVFPNGVPNFSADIDGADAVLDTRTSTTGYSDNPALLARWYALHAMGGRRTTAQIDEDAIIAAANVCDTSVDYGAGATELYKAGYVAKAGQVPAEVLDELAESMAGRWGYSQGKLLMRAGTVGATVATIDSTWLLDRRMQIRPRLPRDSLRNVMQGSFADVDNNLQQLEFTRVVDSTAVSEDGAELVSDVEFGAIWRNEQAQQVAACLLRYERQALTVTLRLKMRAFGLQLFDVVSITLPDRGWTAKLFEVVDRSYALGGGLDITFKEIHSSIYAFGTSFPVEDPAPNTELPLPTTVPTVGTITLTSTASNLADGSALARVRATWADVADRGVSEGGFIELAYLDATQSGGTFQVVRADQLTEHTVVGLRIGKHYLFKARAVNGAGVRGAWSPAYVHQVSGARRARIFWQDTAPTSGMSTDDLWNDTNDDNKPYQYDGSSWVARQFGSSAIADQSATVIGESYSAGPLSLTTSGNFKTVTTTNPDTVSRYVILHTKFTYACTAGGSGCNVTIGYTDGSSPVFIVNISLGAGASRSGEHAVSSTFLLSSGATGSYSLYLQVNSGSLASMSASDVAMRTELIIK